MKRKLSVIVCCLFVVFTSMAQEWMTSLNAAKRLALVQDKMILMMWEGSMTFPLAVIITDENGKSYYIKNLFESIPANEIIWDYFIPVSVSESNYEEMYQKIEKERSQSYLDKFNDNSVKILDAAGNILNIGYVDNSYLNLSDFIEKYALNTSYLHAELKNYLNEQNFYSAYFLSSRYLDYSILTNKKIRPLIIALSEIYLKEAKQYLEENDMEDAPTLTQRVELLELYSVLISNKPKRMLRLLNRMEKNGIEEPNKSKVAFLKYSAHLVLGNSEEVEEWKAQVTSLDSNRAKLLANIYRN